MKEALFYTILMFSLNALAQDKSIVNDRQNNYPKLENGNEKTGVWNLKSESKYTEICSEMKTRYKLLNQSSLVQLYDSIYFWDWDISSSEWINNSKIVNIVYDSKNNLISDVYQEWNGFEWINSERDSEIYDSNNNPIYYLLQIWDGNQWENSQQGTLIYDTQNNLKNELVQDWNGSEWENVLSISYYYDVNNNQTSYLHQNWNGNEWENAWQHLYTYDANKNLTGDLRQVWNEVTWENSDKYTCIFDENNHLINDSSQYFNGAEWTFSATTYNYDVNNKLLSEVAHSYDNNWDYYTQTSYSYDLNGNLINELNQEINGDSLANLAQSTYTYDSNNNQISWLSEYWNGVLWVVSGLDLYGYDDNNFNTSFSLKEWDSSGTEVTTGDSTYIYFHTMVSANRELTNSQAQIKIYPNPATDYLEISADDEILSFNLYNIYGQLQMIQDNEKSQIQRIAINMLSSGVYLVEVKTEKGLFKQKLVIN